MGPNYSGLPTATLEQYLRQPFDMATLAEIARILTKRAAMRRERGAEQPSPFHREYTAAISRARKRG